MDGSGTGATETVSILAVTLEVVLVNIANLVGLNEFEKEFEKVRVMNVNGELNSKEVKPEVGS